MVFISRLCSKAHVTWKGIVQFFTEHCEQNGKRDNTFRDYKTITVGNKMAVRAGFTY